MISKESPKDNHLYVLPRISRSAAVLAELNSVEVIELGLYLSYQALSVDKSGGFYLQIKNPSQLTIKYSYTIRIERVIKNDKEVSQIYTNHELHHYQKLNFKDNKNGVYTTKNCMPSFFENVLYPSGSDLENRIIYFGLEKKTIMKCTIYVITLTCLF